MKKLKLASFLLSIFFLFVQTGHTKEIIYSNQELIRNGSFEEDYRSWFVINCSPTRQAAKDGNFGMSMNESNHKAKHLTFLQNIIFPLKLSSALIDYDYRVRRLTDSRMPAEMKVIIGKSKGFDSYDFADLNLETISPIKIIHNDTFSTTTQWQHNEIELDQNILNSIITAEKEGYFIFLQFILTCKKSNQVNMNVSIDNLSLKIDGKQTTPKMAGLIAYIGRDKQLKQNTIKLLEPNTNSMKTIWTYPNQKQSFNGLDLKWKPDSSELAFISDFEKLFSPTYTNIYAIKPNGKGLRKISNPPLQSTIESEKYPKIKVTGKIKNTQSFLNAPPLSSTIKLWIQGAKDIITLNLKPDEIKSFEVKDVAVLSDDSDTFEPIIVMHWSNDECKFGIEYERPVSDIFLSKADIGTLIFDGVVCNQDSQANSIRNISWTWNGSDIGFSMIGGLRKIDAAGQAIFDTKELLSMSKVRWPDHMAWSPINNYYLYYNYDFPSMERSGIYLATQKEGEKLLINDAKDTSPIWLPDGSGFLYVRDSYENQNIYMYNFKTKRQKRLTYFSNESIGNMSVSKDGKYVVFELHNTWENPIKSDLWIMSLKNPTYLWQATRDGVSTHPDWSRSEVTFFIDKANQSEEIKSSIDKEEKSMSCFIFGATR